LAQQAEANAASGSALIKKEVADALPKGHGSDQKTDVGKTLSASNSLALNDTDTEQNTGGFLQLLDVKQFLVQQERLEKSSMQSSQESLNTDMLFILTVGLCFVLSP